MTDPAEQRPPLPAVRAADADRDAAAERLRDAAAEGRLDLIELEERLGAAYAAKTRADLEALVADLPAAPAEGFAEVEPLALKTKSGSLRKRGAWQVPPRIAAECTSGSIRIDFTEAECRCREVTVDISARSGSVVLIVPKGWGVRLDQASATSGTIKNKVDERPAAGLPLIRVRGTVLSGTIKARYPRRSFRAWLLGPRG
jgi:hypothetical protein